MSHNPEALNSPDSGGRADGQHPASNTRSMAWLKAVPPVAGVDRPMRISFPQNQNHVPPPVPEGAK